MPSAQSAQTFRKFHRYLGYFLAGIMMLYASSGILLIFRGTDFLKTDVTLEKQLEPGLSGNEVINRLKLKGLVIEQEGPRQIRLSQGRYDRETGMARYNSKEYLPVVDQIVHMHKAKTSSPLFFLNIFFGSALLFFATSAFFLFPPSAPALRTGVKVAAAGFLFAIAVVALG